jgi:3-hydroxyacyl-[acyl-carrier-protein] dehydratase
MLNSQEIQAIIPHRYPFLLVDRIVEIEEGVRAVGVKAVTANEPYFQGHFPGYPVMPGVLVLEALAQVGAVAILNAPQNRGRIAFFAGVDGFRWRKQVTPGDVLRLEVQLTRVRGPIGKGTARATVEGELVAEGEVMFALGPSPVAQGTQGDTKPAEGGSP